MLLSLYSIRDIKTESFGPIFSARTSAEAARNFDRLRRDPQSNVYQFPADYQLFRLGQFNDASGELIQKEVPQLVPVDSGPLEVATA